MSAEKASATATPLRLVVVSGLSGAGKSVALRALEDTGFIALDNLPVPLLAAVVEHVAARAAAERREGVALAVDIRSGNLEALPAALQELKARTATDPVLLFLEARDDVLLRRFAETRRAHPLTAAATTTLAEAISAERLLLASVAERAYRLDTSELSPHALRAMIIDWASKLPDSARLLLTLQSFAYRLGVPLDADLVFDARCLPNPYYHAELRPHTGRDEKVAAFLRSQPITQAFADELESFLRRWLPCYQAEPRRYVTVAIGCTGGQHRSVFLAEELARRLHDAAHTLVRHRALSG